MVSRFEIIDFGASRPDAERILFCDGTASFYNPETDLDLSHWRPNRTPAEYRAGTSTEICFRFVHRPRPGDWTAAVNNHLDVDGILSVYALVHADDALRNETAIVQAAEMGDFWSWGDVPAQRLFQGLTRLMNAGKQKGIAYQSIYEEAFERIPAMIAGEDSDSAEVDASLAPLRQGVKLVESGRIARIEVDSRCTQYVIPRDVAGDERERLEYVPGFNEIISDKMLLWPEARAKWDRERVCLVSAEVDGGWLHGLWYPGYLWADTDGLWTVPGLAYPNGMDRYTLDLAPLNAAIERLQQEETAAGRWVLATPAYPFHEALQDLFPLGGRFVSESGEWSVSRLPPSEIRRHFEGIFAAAVR